MRYPLGVNEEFYASVTDSEEEEKSSNHSYHSVDGEYLYGVGSYESSSEEEEEIPSATPVYRSATAATARHNQGNSCNTM